MNSEISKLLAECNALADECEHMLATIPVSKPYQVRVDGWMQECFGEQIALDITERNHRFLEEALELVQAKGCTSDECVKLVGYVFGRPVGEASQEVGGVRVTLSALCNAAGIDEDLAAETELKRILDPKMVEKIREKQKSKPSFSPLPGSYPDRPNAKPRITEQDAREIVASTINFLMYYQNTVNVVDLPQHWFEAEGRALLERLNK